MEYYFGMDPIFILGILMILGLIIGYILGSSACKTPPKIVSIKEALKPALSAGVAGAILGIVIAFLLSLYPIIKVGFAGLYGSFFFFLVFTVGGFAIFFLANLLYFSFPIPYQMKGGMLGALIGMGIAFVVWTTFVASTGPFGAYAKYATTPIREEMLKFFREIAKFKHCFYADPRCPFFVQWDEPERQTHEELLNIEVEFSDQRTLRDEINLLVSLKVKNYELTELRIKPRCYLGKKKDKELQVKNLGKYAMGNEFVFPLGSEEMHTSFRCHTTLDVARQVEAYDIVVELERPVVLQAMWPIYITSNPNAQNMGRSKTVMPFNAPYSIALVSESDMPYEEGKSYDFSVVLKRLDEDTELKFLKQIKITFPENILAECENFQASGYSLEILNVPVEVLRNVTFYDKSEEKYSIPCSLYITDAPLNPAQTIIYVEASYEVVSEHKTQVLRSPV
ncbi:MAG: DMT family transporter [Candidatus Pacearchaeota archaeon]|nr:DMT family transporter [Candidatus Pacearchaeota archaeon]